MPIMHIVCITDLHGRMEALHRILEDAGPHDILLLGGDITNFGSPVDVARVIQAAKQYAPTVLAVAGNCDSAAIDDELDRLGVALHARGFLHENVGIHGLSAIPPWKRGMYELTEEQLTAALESGSRAIQEAPQHVLLAHVPPRGTKADRTFLRIHAGSTAVRAFVDQTGPALVLCGHIHEGRGIETCGKTTVVNCGFGGRGEYAVAEFTGDATKVEIRSAS